MQKTEEKTMLIGMKAIQSYYPRSKDTILKLIKDNGFPAAKVEGVWEADKTQIDAWRRGVILSADKAG